VGQIISVFSPLLVISMSDRLDSVFSAEPEPHFWECLYNMRYFVLTALAIVTLSLASTLPTQAHAAWQSHPAYSDDAHGGA